MILFAKRSKAATPIAVTITGTGDESRCYVTINGTTYSEATTGVEVMPGDTIISGVQGQKLSFIGIYGYVKIDGTEVLTETTGNIATYEWNVPGGITSIAIKLSYNTSYVYGQITVTTA